jgi:hypothetical protein
MKFECDLGGGKTVWAHSVAGRECRVVTTGGAAGAARIFSIMAVEVKLSESTPKPPRYLTR